MPVTLTIRYPNGAVTILVSSTDASGSYNFANVLLDETFCGVGATPPTFSLSASTPANFTRSPLYQGGDSAIDSDNSAGQSVSVVQGTTNNTVDFGFIPPADLQIVKTDGAPTAVPGLTVTYLITVTNPGPAYVTGATVSDPLPAALTGVTYTATQTGGATGFTTVGGGSISDTVTLPVSSTITYVVTGTINPAAVGSLTNTATVTPPANVIDPTPDNNISTDTDALDLRSNLSITKTDGVATYTPGVDLAYAIVVANAGPSNVVGATVADTFDAALGTPNWTATGTAGTAFTASGSGNLSQTVSIPVGGSLTYTIAVAQVDPAKTGDLVNTATVAAPGGVTDSTPGNNTATDTDTADLRSNLSITKTDGAATYTPGMGLTYTIVVANAGPSNVAGATVADTFDAALGTPSWTAAGTAGTVYTASGSGSLSQTVSIPIGGSLTYTVAVTQVNPAKTGDLVNTATVAVPGGVTDSTPGNNTATDTDTADLRSNLSITKTDGAATYTPGVGLAYTIVVANAGPSNVVGATVADTFDAALGTPSWTATGTAGTAFTASGSGNLSQTVSIPVGGSLTYTVAVAQVDPAKTGDLVNTATVAAPGGVTDSTPGNNTATDTDTADLRSNLSITKTDGAATYTPGVGLTYTIVVANAGPSNVVGATVADTFDAALGTPSWTAAGTAGAVFTASGSGNLSQAVSIPAGGSLTYTVAVAQVDPAKTGELVNTATVTVPGGVTDSTPGNNTATDTDTADLRSNLSITKTDGAATYTPGVGLTYTIVVANAGPSNVVGAMVADTFDAALGMPSWTATGTAGTVFSVSGSGNLSQTVSIPVGGSLTYTVAVAQVDSAKTGDLVNTATVTVPGGVTDPTPGNNTATDTDTADLRSNLSISKTDGAATYTPGVGLTYTIVVDNAGPSNVVGATVADTFDAALGTPSWTATGTAGVVFTASGSGNLSQTVSIPVGSSLTYTVAVTQVDPAKTGELVNTATVTVPGGVTDPTPGNNTATDTDTADLRSNLSISKTDGAATYTPGAGLTYTIVVANAGPSNVAGATVADTFDAALGTPSWTAAGTAGTVYTASGSGSLSQTVSIPVGGSLTYTVAVTQVDPAKTGDLVNTATVAVPGGVTDPTPGNDTATDTDTAELCSNLSITKTDGATTYTPGVGLTYTIVVANAGPSNVVGATVADTFDAALGMPSWTATGTAGTMFSASGSGNLSQTVSIPVGGSLTYTVAVAQVDPAKTGDLVNTATVAAPGGVTDSTPGNNTATDTDTADLRSNLSITKTDGAATYTPGVGLTYTIVVANAGPSNIVGAAVADTFDAALGTPSWTAAGTAGTVFTASGSGNLSQAVSIPVGGSLTYTVAVTQVDPAKTGDLVNTATVAAPGGVTDPTPGNNTATDTDTADLRSNLSISKTDGAATYTPGVGLTYTIVVANAGPSNVVGATVADTFDAALGTPSWTAAGTAGTVFTASGSGNLSQAVSIPVGGSLTYTVAVTQVDPAKTGDLVNTATVAAPGGVTDSTPGNNTATDTDTADLRSNLSISKTDGAATYTPGVGLTYTIVVANAGPSNVVGATVSDTFDGALGTPSWTAAGTAGTVFSVSGSGSLSQTVSIPVGGSLTYTVAVAQVDPAKTGDLVNTATIAVPDGVADSTPGNNTATDTDTTDLRSNLSISKTDGAATYTPGMGLTYTIVVANAGPSNVVGATVSDTFDGALGTPSWTAAGTAGAVFTASGSGNLSQAVSIPVGGSLTYTVAVTQVDPAKTGDLVNTATVAAPGGVTDSTPGNNTATDTDTADLRSNLSISKTDGAATYTPGVGLTYTIVVANAGPSNVVGATVSDTFDGALGTPSWTAAGTAGTVYTTSGSGNLSQTVSIPVGGSLTYTIAVTQVNPAKTGDLVNTATVTVPGGVTDPTPGNNTATDTDTADQRSNLSISKTDGAATYTPGVGLTYTIVVANAGPSNVAGAAVADTFDAALGTPSWTATGTAGTVFTASGSGNLSQTVSIPVGGSLTYTVAVAQVDSAKTGDLVNTATVTVPGGVTDSTSGNNTATDTDTADLRSNLSITKTDGAATYTPGVGLTYTIVVANAGPSNVVGATVADTFDAALGTPNWTATGTAGTVYAASGSGNLSQTVSIPVGGSLTYTVAVAQVDSARTGDLVNTATVAAPGGVTDSTPGNNTATDTDTADLRSNLSITKTDGAATYTPGMGLTYTIVVANAGPSNVAGATVADTFDAALGTPSWTATGTAGTVYTASGSGSLSQTVSIPVGGSLTYTVAVTQVNPAKTGDLVNTATVAAPGGVTDSTPGNNTATDTDTADLRSNLSITKTDGAATYTPGVGLTYTIVVANAGPSNVVGATVADTFDGALGTPSWTATGTAGTVFSVSGSGNLSQTVSIPVGGSLTYTVAVAQVDPAKTGDLVNTATVTVPGGVTDSTPGNNTATDTDAADLRSNLSISKTDGAATYTPGVGLTYTIVVANAGPSNVAGATVADTLDAALGTPCWTATGTAGVVYTASGSGNLSQTVSIPVGGSLTYTVAVTQVDPAKTGDLVNTATVAAPGGVTDSTPGNNTATDTDTADLRSNLSISKTDGAATYTPGVGLTYTIVVANAGPSNVVGATVSDTFDAALGTPSWTAAGTAGTVYTTSGSGNLAQTVSIPVGGSLTYTIAVAQVDPAKTGDLVNTATVAAPGGVTDSTPGNNTATDTDTADLRSNLSISKTDGAATYTPGVGLTYTIVVANAGPSNVVGATVSDTFDGALGTPSWTAAGTAGTVFSVSGSGNLSQTVSIPVGGSLTYTVAVAQVDPARTGDLVNTATVTVPGGVTDPTPGNNTATDTDTADLRSNLSITKTDGAATYTPGVGLTYTIVVANAGPSNVVGATVVDTFAAALGTPSWTATGTAGTVFSVSGSGSLSQTVSIPVGGSLTYTVAVAQVDPAKTGDLVNTATIAVPDGVADSTPGNNTATDTDTTDLRSNLSISKTDGAATYTPGMGLTYTIVVANAGPSNVVGATVSDTFDGALGTPSWTAAGTAGAVFTANGSGNLSQAVSIPVGGSLTYTVAVTQVDPAKTGDLVNTATVAAPGGVTDSTPGNNTATDTDTADLRSNLSISKTDGAATYTPGVGLTYTIVVANAGPSNVVGATVSDTFDGALGTPSWTAAGTAGTVYTTSGSGNLSQTVSIPVGGSLTYTIAVTQVNPAKTGDLVNTATVTVPGGVTDSTSGNNTATDTDTADLRSNLSITKTDGAATYTPGVGLTYTIVVANAGPSNVVGAAVADTFDAALGTPSWTAAGTAGTVYTASGSGNLSQAVSIPAGGSLTYTVAVAQVDPAKTGDLINTATVAVPGGVTDPTPGNNTAADTDTADLRSNLSITKTDGAATYTPGAGLTYTIVVANAGPSNIVGAAVADTFDAALGTPSWTAAGTAGTVFTASGSGNLSQAVSIPVGGSLTYTVAVTQVDPAKTGDLVNTATVAAPGGVTDSTPGNNTATDTDTADLRSNLSISKTDGAATYTPGVGLTYTIVVANAGPSNVVGATVSDTFDGALGTPSWTAAGTAGTVFSVSGSGNLSQTVSIPVGGSLTYTVAVAQVDPARTGDLVNTATVTVPGGVTDPTPGNNTSTDTDTADLRSNLSITKTDGAATYTPGVGLTYTIVVANAGPSNVVGATVVDTFAAALGTPSWTATGTAGTVFSVSGSGSLSQTVSIPVGGSLTYTVAVAQVDPAKTGDLVNTATIAVPDGVADSTPGNNTATDTDTTDLRSNLSISKTDGAATYTPGMGLTYTIVVANAGPSNVVGATVSDTFDGALGTPSWTAAGTAGAVFTASGSGNLSQAVSIPVGGSLTYTVAVTQVDPAKTGDLVNTATVAAPGGVTDSTPGNNTATDTDTADLRSNLSISKTDGAATYTPGVGLTYTIVVANAGPSNVVGATVADTFDGALGTPSWTAAGTAGTVYTTSGSGNLSQTVSIPVGGSLTYTIAVTQVNPAKTGDLVNTATVTVPGGVTDSTPGNNTAADTDTADLRSNLSITKTDGATTYTPGVGLTYTIVVANAGPSNVVGAAVADTFDAALGTPSWTATGTAGTVFTASGSGNLSQTVSIPVGGSLTYTVAVAQVDSAKTGDLVNTATVTVPGGVTDSTSGNNTATDTDTADLRSNLSITKTDGAATYTPGVGLTYTIVVANAGPSNVVGATVADTFDAALGTPNWTATGTAGTVYAASGSGNLSQTVSIPVGGSLTYTVAVAQVDSARTGDLVNTATVAAPGGVTDSTPGNNTATDTDTADLRSNLSITKTDGAATYTPGMGLTYTIVVANAGPSNVAGATVADTFDAALGTPSWTATGTAGTVYTASGSGSLSQTVSIPVGGSLTYTVAVTQVNPAKTGDLVNTATVAAPGGVTDSTPGNNTATDTDTADLRSNLSITKTDGAATYTPGVGLTYTIVVANAGPSNVVGATVADTFDGALGTPSWTATGTAGTVFSVSGSGNLSQTVSIPVGGSLTYTVAVAQVDPAKTGDLVNTATVTVPGGVTDSTPGNNTATDTDAADLRSNLSISKTDGAATYTPGVGLTYTIVVANAGPSNVAGATVADTLDAALGTPCWTATGTAGVVYTASGSGNLSQTVSIPVGGSLTYTVAVTQVDPAKTGDLVNTATVAAPGGVTDSTPGNNTATDTDTADLRSNLSISKTDGAATYTPGVGLTYTIVVANAGPSNVVGATVADTFDAALGTPSWTAAGTAGTVYTTSGSGNLAQTVSIPVGGSLTYTIAVAQVDPAKTGDLVNTATAAVPGGVTDPTLGNNTATDTDTADLRSNLSITKTDGAATYTPGAGLTYTIVVANAGPSNVAGATVSDTFDAALGTPSWTAAGTAGTVFTASGSGNLSQAVSIPVGGSLTYTVAVAQVDPAKTGELVNTATVAVPGGVTDSTPGNNTATDTDTADLRSNLSISKTDGSATYTPGVGLTYTIVVNNAGPSNVVGATVADTFDGALGTPSWTAAGTAGTMFTASGSGNLSQAVSIPVGGSLTYTVAVAQVNPAKTGDLVNTATVTVPVGVADSMPGNNTATDTDTADLRSNLSITKTDGAATYTPGVGLTYTIVVANAGPSNVVGATVVDTFGAALGTPSWTATGTAGTVFSVSGSGNLSQTVSIPVGGSLTYTVAVAQVDPAKTGDLVNTATVTVPVGVADSMPGNNTSTDTDTADLRSNLSITKTDGAATYTPGVGLTYTIVVNNAGPSNVVAAMVADTFDAALGTPNWTATGTAGTVYTTSGSGNLSQTVSIPVGGSLTYTVAVAQVDPAKTGDLVNTATVTVPGGVTDSTPGNNTSTDTDTADLRSNLSITKTDGAATYTPGMGLTYTIVVNNAGPSNVVGATVADTFAAALGTPSWTTTGTAGTVFTASGSGNLSQTVSIPVGGSLTYTVAVAQVDPAKTGDLVNTATIAAPGGVTDSTPGNNTATDTDTADLRTDLSVAKTDGKTTVLPGTATTYTITVTNNGPSTLTSITVIDNLPAGLLNPTFIPSKGSYNSSTGLWSGLRLATGQSASLVLIATVDPNAQGVLINTVTVAPPTGVTDPNVANNVATDADGIVPFASLSGVVYLDVNNNGVLNPGEPGLAGSTLVLTGKDILGNVVNRNLITGRDGTYQFTHLLPSDSNGYTITQTVQPTGWDAGDVNAPGTLGGQAIVHVFQAIVTPAGASGQQYNYSQIDPSLYSKHSFIKTYQNPHNQFDVNADAAVTPLDALVLVNAINLTGPRPLAGLPTLVGGVFQYIDVNGDDLLTPLDALDVISQLDVPAGAGEGEGTSAAVGASGGSANLTVAGSPTPAVGASVLTDLAVARIPALVQPARTSWAQAVDAALSTLDFPRSARACESQHELERASNFASTVDDLFGDESWR